MITNDFKNIDFEKAISDGRALCFDYGLKRTGLALSDLTWQIASPFKVIETSQLFNKIQDIFNEYRIGLVVIGIPIALNGGMEGAQHKLVNEFCEHIQQFMINNNIDLNILQYDERMSTAAANRFLLQHGKKKYNTIDKIAASIILQNVLDRVNYNIK